MRLFTNPFSAVWVLAAAAPCRALLIPEPYGPYSVALQHSELVDDNRLDPWNSSHPRRIMISRFDPVPRDKCKKMCTEPYMSQFLADAEDNSWSVWMSEVNLTWPRGDLGKLDLQVCCDARPCPDGENSKYPIVLFGTGLNTTRLFYSAVAQEIASHGYTVVTMDHPYETDFVEFPDGTVIYTTDVIGDPDNLGPVEHAMDIRAQDASFVLDTLGVPHAADAEASDHPDAAKVGMVGHSLGGAAAGAVMLNDTRVVAGVDLDGIMLGDVLNAGVGRPGTPQSFMLFGSTGHDSSVEGSWQQLLDNMDERHPEEWIKELSLDGSLHHTFGDYGVIADVAGWREDKGLEAMLVGEILGSKAMEILGAYMDDFMQMTLRGGDGKLVVGPSPEFPEVLFVD